MTDVKLLFKCTCTYNFGLVHEVQSKVKVRFIYSKSRSHNNKGMIMHVDARQLKNSLNSLNGSYSILHEMIV